MTAVANYAAKGDTTNSHFTDREKLIATYVDDENQFWYTVSEANGKPRIRKMSIKRDVNYAREINKKAKKLIGQEVYFGVTAGWNPNVWFNDVVSVEISDDDIPF
jgi:hypothetical protein